MGTGAITSYVDVAQLVLYAFWIFFFGLIYYLIREGHREGYPMETDRGGVINGWPSVPPTKIYRLADGREMTSPQYKESQQPLNAVPSHRFAGAPLDPVGNPLLAGVGPGAWANRADVPDHDAEGHPKIQPLRSRVGYGVANKDVDPRGMAVMGADGVVAGTVVDLWIDAAEMLFRYLEVRVTSNGRSVLLPMTMARITRSRGVEVHAIYSEQFADVPGTRSEAVVTALEEEKIVAYYGAGLLYADESRAEPLL